MAGLRFNVLILFLLAILFFLQYRLWFESGGLRDKWQLRNALITLNSENEKLKKSNEELLFQIKRLQNSRQAIESRARDELGMIKKGETYYQIVK